MTTRSGKVYGNNEGYLKVSLKNVPVIVRRSVRLAEQKKCKLNNEQLANFFSFFNAGFKKKSCKQSSSNDIPKLSLPEPLDILSAPSLPEIASSPEPPPPVITWITSSNFKLDTIPEIPAAQLRIKNLLNRITNHPMNKCVLPRIHPGKLIFKR